MNYGVNESRRVFCKTHQVFYPENERCPSCAQPKPAASVDYCMSAEWVSEAFDQMFGQCEEDIE